MGSHMDDTVTEKHASPGTRLPLANGPALLGAKAVEPPGDRGPLGVTRESKILTSGGQRLVSTLVTLERITDEPLQQL